MIGPLQRVYGVKPTLNCLILGVLFFLLSLPSILNAKIPPIRNLDYPRLIETKELAQVMNHSSVRIVDLRGSFLDYLTGHIPNAVYFPYQNLQVPRNGIPAQLPEKISLEKIVGDYQGISNDMWVVLYSEKSNPNATFLAWTLDFLVHKKVGVLNGGWEKWVSETLLVTQEYPSVRPKKFAGKIKREILAEKKWIRDRLSSKNVVIVDARPPKQYTGEEGEEIRRGHIPGARNVHWETTLDGENIRVWKNREDLEKLFAEAGVTKDKEIVVHCRTGREASHLYFTLKYVLCFPHVRLYRGSWVEWSADQNLPVRMGVEP